MLISILIPCFNAEKLVEQSIESALAQTWPDKEIVVVDDGSTDGSLEIIRRYDGRIRWETGPNRGACATRNRLLELARGDWVQYLDADDYLLPEKIAEQVAFLAKHSDCDVIYSPTTCERRMDGVLICFDEHLPPPYDPWVLLAHWQLPQTGGPLWRRASILLVGGWNPEQPCCQEHELFLRLLQSGARFEHCDVCLAVYRDWDHGARISNRNPDEVVRQRLLILDRIETNLKAKGELSPLRHRAINDTRHAEARKLWRANRSWAKQVAKRIKDSDADYYPSQVPTSPFGYSLAYRFLGFVAAEILAQSKRTALFLKRAPR